MTQKNPLYVRKVSDKGIGVRESRRKDGTIESGAEEDTESRR